ncbi:LuxR C-terminal-related transcriptional regulator [Streptomyces chrestomyceticus]|uniref:helix-turn-helix transcriptional regulator n=1 Tax=Streptomyces chrestomyceticus TaxID=68185 RepID=UPI0033D83B0A
MSEEQVDAPPLDKLTKGQRRYVADFAEYASTKEIARWHGVAEGTVATARRTIMKRLGLTSLDEWSTFVRKYGDEAWGKPDK